MSNIEDKFKEKLPNFNHLKKIRERLWPKIGNSKVSIMIGAGFSLNARKLDDSLTSMSTWPVIKERIENELDRNEISGNSDVLTIGEEYANEYGRASLDDLLKECIPDEHYEPHDVHKMLLRLPWSEVYTTNYDTLLERTLPYTVDQKYSIVHDVKDIPSSTSPRIVKLHGSFPSTRPFIFTKSDFDTYNKNFAPFVNMVQQSIMENTFVLLGFSGEDPNFQQWIKWVRGNLGNHMPKVYMLANDEEARREDLEENGITVIDFKEVYEGRDKIYELMFTDIFDFLSYRDKKDEKYWPYLSYTSSHNNKSLLDIFKENRESYPGWLILPETIRRNNLNKIQMAAGELINEVTSSNISLRKKTDIVNEINWIYDIFNIPIDFRLHRLMENLVKENHGYTILMNEIVLRLLTESRLDCNEEAFQKYSVLLENQSLKKELYNRFTYELIQMEVLMYDYEIANSLLEKWDLEKNDLEWLIKKAVIYFKIGESSLSKKLLRQNLNTIREIIARNSNHKLLSLEGLTLSLLLLYGDRDAQSFKHRFEYLESELSNPKKELESLYYSVKEYEQINSVRKVQGFDPNSISKTFKFENTIDNNLISSYRTIKVYDDYGLTILNNQLQKESINTALINLEPSYRLFTWSINLRIGEYKNIEQFFSRDNVRKMEDEDISLLTTMLINSFNKDFQNERLLELLSRLYFVLDKEMRNKIDKITLELFNNPEFYKLYRVKSQNILHNLFRRILFGKNKKEKEKFIAKIYDLPILGEPSGTLSMIKVDEFNAFDPSIAIDGSLPITLKISRDKVERLLLIVENEEGWSRDLALQRLKVLFETNNLTTDHKIEFQKSIANLFREDEDFESKFLLISYLLIISEDGDLQSNYLENLLAKPFPKSFDKSSGSISFGEGLQNRLKDLKNALPKLKFEDKCFIGFDDKIYNTILQLFFEWWKDQETWLLTNQEEDIINSDDDLILMVNFLRISLLSNMPLSILNEDSTKKLLHIFTKLQSHKENFALMLTPVLFRLQVLSNVELQKVYNGLSSNDNLTIEASTAALHDIFYLCNLKKVHIDLSELKFEALNVLRFGKELALNHILRLLISLIKDMPEYFHEHEYESIIDKLNSLLIYYSNDSSRTLLTPNEKLELFSNISNLSGEIYRQHPGHRYKLNSLKKFVLNERLPEVRQFIFLFEE